MKNIMDIRESERQRMAKKREEEWRGTEEWEKRARVGDKAWGWQELNPDALVVSLKPKEDV